MPDAVTEAVETPPVVALAQTALFVEVRDVPDLRQSEPPLYAFSSGPADLELAELGGEIAQLLVSEPLIVENQYGIVVDRFPEIVNYRRGDWSSEIHAAHLPDEG